MEKRHYITSLFLLILPVVVIYALTSYGIEEPQLNQDNKPEIKSEAVYACQQQKLNKREGKSLRIEPANKRQLK